MENLTPMIAQYHNIKKDYQDCLLLYRLGDFYELFYEDAIVGSKELNIVLIRKKISKDKDIPMCGIPYHSTDSYIYKLVSKSYDIHVAKLGGVKEEIVHRALDILSNLENQSLSTDTLNQPKEIYNLFESQTQENPYKNTIYDSIIEEIENIDIGNITPLDALIILNSIKNRIKTLKSIDK